MAVVAVRFAPAATADTALDARAIAALAPRAPAGDLRVAGAGWSGWIGRTFLRERVEGQLLAAAEGVAVLFDGRLDPDCKVGGAGGDAARVLAAFRAGEENLLVLAGVFAFAIVDERRRCVWLGRDATGQRPLWWTRHGHVVAAASEAHAALRLAGRTLRENEAAVAAHFALRPPPGAAGWFADVEEVVPGTLLRIDAVGARARDFATPESPRAWLRLPDDDAYADAWHAALASAVDAALGDARAPGISLSGGLDSGALAACARDRVAAYSWSLPNWPQCDEGAHVRAICAHTGATPHVFDGDALLPLGDADAPVHPDAPSANAFRALKQQQLALARSNGCQEMLSGNYGDHVYPEADAWLAGLLRSRRGTVLGNELRGRIRQFGARSLWRDQGWRAPLRRMLRPVQSPPPAWLGDRAREALAAAPPSTDAAGDSRINRRLRRAVLGRSAALDASLDTFWSDRHGIELRYPYRDPRVLAFVLALPPDVQWRHGQEKALTRRMLVGRLPEGVRQRPKSGSLLPFFRAALRGRSRPKAEALLFAPDARWPAYVRREALEGAWNTTSPVEADDLLLWQAVSHERWWRALAREWPMLGSKT